jgi:signal transduction histidine kinase
MARPHPILWFKNHPLVTDGLFGLLVAVPAVVASLQTYVDEETSVWADNTPWWRPLLALLSVAPIWFRRRHPAAVLATVVAFQIACDLTHTESSDWSGVVIAVYSLAAHYQAERRRPLWWAMGAVIAAQVTVASFDDPWSITDRVAFSVALLGAFAIGDNMRQRRERVANLAERAERAEREQEMLAHQRVTEERTRIAREMHDVVAHSVSMMTIQAAAARRQLHRNPAQAEAALETIEATGRTAMDEMRRILGVLRSERDEPGYAPQPSLASLPELIAADASLPIAASIDEDFSGVPASTQLAAYRLVQEALTNVRRHAGVITTVEISAHRTGNQLNVEVTDDGRGASASPNGQGFGLIGMRERVAIANGRLEAGPRSGGGWRIAASFDLSGERQ